MQLRISIVYYCTDKNCKGTYKYWKKKQKNTCHRWTIQSESFPRLHLKMIQLLPDLQSFDYFAQTDTISCRIISLLVTSETGNQSMQVIRISNLFLSFILWCWNLIQWILQKMIKLLWTISYSQLFWVIFLLQLETILCSSFYML